MQYIRFKTIHFRVADIIICLLFLVIPLLVKLPFRVNIFLSWEGAYRLYIGQTPFKDFGLPLGFGYWLIPMLFFKIFGPTFFTLIKAQVVINLISLLSLRGILYNLKVKPILISLSILIFCLSYVIYNFWPWYNHSVVVFELASFYFLIRSLCNPHKRYMTLNLILSAFTAFLSFFTKQDAGALCFVICLMLLIYHFIITKEKTPLIIFFISYAIMATATIIPLLQYDFLYWFNYGQTPHNPRLSAGLLLNVLFSDSIWEKIYLCLFVILLVMSSREKIKMWIYTREQAMLTIICISLIGQAIITRVTSPLPTDHMTYFHAFAFVLLASFSELNRSIENVKNLAIVTLIIGVSFSAGYWNYINTFFGLSKTNAGPKLAVAANKTPWIGTHVKGFENVLMPQETVEGITRLLSSEVYQKDSLKVLNMSELTPLALEMKYSPLVNQPLWYHLNIGIFQQEVETLCTRVKQKKYDVVLFEDIPDLTHFYPYQVRDTLRTYYKLQDKFLAPRKLENSMIEVYVRTPDKRSDTLTSN